MGYRSNYVYVTKMHKIKNIDDSGKIIYSYKEKNN